ncbi:hypothetical protein DH2020_016148 [Rehmannia glutinosa]|uniref:Phosphatidylinositol-3,4,5-trisphosphate 3-phosphatase n=1 Tax=Rehmannia glutinosa TaxID=99300 RepID=A0ABR0WX88_REHGL
MESETAKSSPSHPDEGSDVQSPPSIVSDKRNSAQDSSSMLSTSAISSWAKSLKLPQMQQDPQTTNAGKFTFSRLASGLGLQKETASTETANNNSTSAQSGVIGSFTKGIVDSSLNAVKAVQVKARHIVSQNKRRYQKGGFDLDMTYITENIIAMGFPAGDLSSGLFGYFEGFYRNHMEEVIKFFETHHKGVQFYDKTDVAATLISSSAGNILNTCGRVDIILSQSAIYQAIPDIKILSYFIISEVGKLPVPSEVGKLPVPSEGKYKVYNLCSERLYDASLFEGKVASFPFDDHNCPPIHLIKLFCQSAYSWLKEDILNVVVVHCKAGKARTGLMICSLLLFLKFFPSAEECISYYNQQRCTDGKGLILPSQIRYVKYFERILTQFDGETPPGRRCMLRGFRLHNCPYWVRPSVTISDHNGACHNFTIAVDFLQPEDFWIRAPKKGIVVFALPGEPGLTELVGTSKFSFMIAKETSIVFLSWMNTTMMDNRVILDASDLDDFDNRKLPSPGFQVEIVMIDYDGTIPPKTKTDHDTKGADGKSIDALPSSANKSSSQQSDPSRKQNNEDDVFSDSEGEESSSSRSRVGPAISAGGTTPHSESGTEAERVSSVSHQTAQLSLGRESTSSQSKNSHEMRIDGVEKASTIPNMDSTDIKAIAADASVFSFGDDEDYESE